MMHVKFNVFTTLIRLVSFTSTSIPQEWENMNLIAIYLVLHQNHPVLAVYIRVDKTMFGLEVGGVQYFFFSHWKLGTGLLIK